MVLAENVLHLVQAECTLLHPDGRQPHRKRIVQILAARNPSRARISIQQGLEEGKRISCVASEITVVACRSGGSCGNDLVNGEIQLGKEVINEQYVAADFHDSFIASRIHVIDPVGLRGRCGPKPTVCCPSPAREQARTTPLRIRNVCQEAQNLRLLPPFHPGSRPGGPSLVLAVHEHLGDFRD